MASRLLTDCPECSSGFYGITVSETDGSPSFSGITKINFNSNDFYIEQNPPNTDEVIVNFRGSVAAGSGEANTASNLGAGEGIFAQKVGVDLQFKSLVAGTNVTLSSDATTITINSSASGSGGGFYGILFKESESGGFKERDDVLVFDSQYFYLSSSGDSKPIVSLIDQFARPSEIGPGFYGIIVKESDNSIALRDDTISFLSTDFSVTEVADKPQVALASDVARLSDISPGFYGITVAETDGSPSLRGIVKINFNSSDFYVDQNNTDEANVSIRGIDTSNFATRSEIGPGFYGIIVKESDNSIALKDDTISFLSTDFEVTEVSAKPQVALAATVARLSDIGPGFYGIKVAETDGTPSYSGIVKINFNSSDFYVEQNANTDEVIVSSRGIDTSNFATRSEIGPGFYGIIVKESDDSVVLKDDTISFLSTDFDVTEVSSKPQVALASTVARLTDIGPGFYGITVAETDGSPSLKGIVKINFNSSDFYVDQNNTDEANVSIRGIDTSNFATKGEIGPGFYGIIVKESDNSVVLRDDTISFLTTDFDVTEVNDKPQVSLATDVARLSDIGPGFYGIRVAETDGSPSYTGIVKVNFNSADFYVEQNANTDEVIISSRGIDTSNFATRSEIGPGFYGIIVKESDNSVVLKDDTISFLATDFDVTEVSDKPQVAISTSIARLTDIGPGFYGIIVEESDGTNTHKDDTVRFLATDFNISTVSDKPQIALASDVARLSDIGPGFYGLTVAETDNTPSYKKINTLKFLAAEFYLSQNSPNTDEVIVNLKNPITKINESGGFVDFSADLVPSSSGIDVGQANRQFGQVHCTNVFARSNNGPFDVLTTGNVFGSTSQTGVNARASVESFAGANRASSLVIGRAVVSGANTSARVRSSNDGTLTVGVVDATQSYGGTPSSYINNGAYGALLLGRARGSASFSGGAQRAVLNVGTGGQSSALFGYAIAGTSVGAYAKVQVSQPSSFTLGKASSSTGASAYVHNNGASAFLQGLAGAQSNIAGQVVVSGTSSFTVGYASASTINITGGSAFCVGRAVSRGSISATGLSSFVFGYTSGGTISATATNSVQFFNGINALANSIQIGNAAIVLRGDAASDPGGIKFIGSLDHDGPTVGFFYAVPVTRQRDCFYLVVPGTPTTDSTLASVAGTGADADINNNFAEVAAKINIIRDALRKYGLLGPKKL